MIYNGYNRRLEDWIINHQTGRRNLTKSQLVKAYAMVEEQLAEEAKKRMLSGKKDPVANLPQGSEKKRNKPTTQIVAEKLGVSRKTYEGMKTVVAEGSAEQIKRMDEGGKGNGVSAIAKKAKERMMAGKSNPDQKSGQGKTDRQLAKIAGVSHDTIHRVEVRIWELLKQKIVCCISILTTASYSIHTRDGRQRENTNKDYCPP